MSNEENQVVEETLAEAPAPQAEAPAEGNAAPDLTVQDLQAIKSIIDVASTRGAFDQMK